MPELSLLAQDQFLSLKFTFKVKCASFSQAFKIISHVIDFWKQRCTVNPKLIKLFQYLFLIPNPELNLAYQIKLPDMPGGMPSLRRT